MRLPRPSIPIHKDKPIIINLILMHTLNNFLNQLPATYVKDTLRIDHRIKHMVEGVDFLVE
jgi:hypothetical protein